MFCPIHISTLLAIHVSPLLAKKTKIMTLLVIRIAPSLAMYVTPPLANLGTHIEINILTVTVSQFRAIKRTGSEFVSLFGATETSEGNAQFTNNRCHVLRSALYLLFECDVNKF